MTSFTYEGDESEVAKWLAFARPQQMRMAGLGSPGWNLQPEADVLIMIRTNPPHIHIKVGGGNYHFIYRNLSLSENYYFKGFKPASGEELTDITTNKAKDAGASDNALTLAAPLSDRHAWYGDGNVTVLSGYGSLYASPRAPHGFMDKGTQYLGYVDIYNKGSKSYTAPFAAFNGAMREQFLIGIQTNGDVEYITPGEDVSHSLPSVIGDLPDVAASTFEQTQIHRGVDQFNFDLNYEYDSHEMVDGFEEASCYWSFSKDGSKAVGVCYVNFAVEYLAYRWIDDARHTNYDKTETVVVPFLIELSFPIGVDGDGNPLLTMSLDQITQKDWLSEGKLLLAADYNYYPPRNPALPEAHEPPEGELMMAYVHRTFYEWKVYAEETGDGVTPDNMTLTIDSKSQNYITDQFHFNTEFGTVSHDPDVTEWIDGRVECIDLRSMFYVAHERGRSDLGAGDVGHRIVFRGKEAYSCLVDQPGPVQLDTRKPYTELSYADVSQGSTSTGWVAVDFGGKMAANPFDDNFFSYYRGNIGGDSYVIDAYCFYDEDSSSHKAIYQYHLLSTGGDIDDQHCNANVWVI